MNMKERTEERLGLGDCMRIYYVWKWRLHVYAGAMVLATLLCAAGWAMGLICDGRSWLPDALELMNVICRSVQLVVVTDFIVVAMIATYDMYCMTWPKKNTSWVDNAGIRCIKWLGVALVLGGWSALLEAWHPLAA